MVLADDGIETWPWENGDVVAIDFLVLFMSVAAACHAVTHKKLGLLASALLLGVFTEAGSIRAGGTHCHNKGLLNFAYCSSANSVVYYMPWIYSSVTAADRLVGDSRWALPWICGALTFGMCGICKRHLSSAAHAIHRGVCCCLRRSFCTAAAARRPE